MFSEQAEKDIDEFISKGIIQYYKSKEEVKEAITEVLVSSKFMKIID